MMRIGIRGQGLALVCLWACAPAEPSGGERPPGDAAEAGGEAPATRVETPATPAGRLLARSIAFHDPEGSWGSRSLAIDWVGTDDGGEERVAVQLRLHPDGSTFELSGRYGGSEIRYRTRGDSVSATVDGESELTPETRRRMRLDREDGLFWRSYYGFLAGLPMKLRDPGARIDPEPIETEFMGSPVTAIRVSYDPNVGGDVWYFYFDPDTARLVGCRFHHDEAAGDGEYLVFEGLVEAAGLRLPRTRRWYMNVDDRFLGEDEIRGIAIVG